MKADAWWDRYASRVVLGLGVVMLAAYVVAAVGVARPGGRLVFGDATHHFVQLRSIVFDRDLSFQNEYRQLYGLQDAGPPGTEWIFTELTPTGRVRNYMPVGPALLWMPLYGLFAAVLAVSSMLGLGARPDGYEMILQLAPGITGVIAATAAAWASWRIARQFAPASAAAFAVLTVWLGSHAIYYSLVSPTYSHAPSMLASTAFFGYWLNSRQSWTIARFAVLGGLGGLAALMRWQDVIFLLVPAVEILRWPGGGRARILAGAGAGALAAVAFLPQMIVWQALYGQPLAVPQGPSFMRWAAPHLIDVLFSTNHGLVTWTPVLLASIAGLVTLCRRDRSIALPVGLVIVITWYVNAAVADWWAGEAFGARRFLSLFPLFVAGAAVWLQPEPAAHGLRTRRAALAALAIVANGLLLLQYQLFMKGLRAMAPYPTGWMAMWVERFLVPFRLLAWLLR